MKIIRNHIIYFCCFIATVASLCACKNSSKSHIEDEQLSTDVVKNPVSASADSSKIEKQLPKILFSKDLYDFGKIMEGEKISYAFKFRNTGKSDLVISSASASCGCTVPEWPKDPIAPGKEGFIKVVFNSEGRAGSQRKTITIISNTIPNSKVLTIKGEVIKTD